MPIITSYYTYLYIIMFITFNESYYYLFTYILLLNMCILLMYENIFWIINYKITAPFKVSREPYLSNMHSYSLVKKKKLKRFK